MRVVKLLVAGLMGLVVPSAAAETVTVGGAADAQAELPGGLGLAGTDLAVTPPGAAGDPVEVQAPNLSSHVVAVDASPAGSFVGDKVENAWNVAAAAGRSAGPGAGSAVCGAWTSILTSSCAAFRSPQAAGAAKVTIDRNHLHYEAWVLDFPLGKSVKCPEVPTLAQYCQQYTGRCPQVKIGSTYSPNCYNTQLPAGCDLSGTQTLGQVLENHNGQCVRVTTDLPLFDAIFAALALVPGFDLGSTPALLQQWPDAELVPAEHVPRNAPVRVELESPLDPITVRVVAPGLRVSVVGQVPITGSGRGAVSQIPLEGLALGIEPAAVERASPGLVTVGGATSSEASGERPTAFLSAGALSVPLPQPSLGSDAGLGLLLGFLILVAPAWLLYRRVRPERVMENAVRTRVHHYVVCNPGTTAGRAAVALELHYTTCEHHLRILRDLGYVEGRRFGRHIHWFENHKRYGAAEARALAATYHPTAAAVVRALVRSPGACGADVARDVGLRRSSLKHHLDRLLARGVIVSRREGRVMRLCVAPGALDAVAFVLETRPRSMTDP